MKITLNELLNSEQALVKLTTLKLPIKVSYKLSKLVNKLTSDYKLFYEKKDELLKELGTLTEDKKTYTFTDENAKKFAEELKKLTDLEVEIDFEKINIEELGEISIEPNLLLDWVFTS